MNAQKCFISPIPSISSYTGNFRRTNTFGIPTPNDVAGRLCKKVIGTWRTCQPDPPYVSKVYADHLDFRYPKLGLPQEQNCIRTKQGDKSVKVRHFENALL